MGINKVDDIVTTCIKGEDQGQAILFYLNNLNSEIDQLEEMRRNNFAKIEMLEGSKQLGELNFQEFAIKNENNYKLLQQKIIDKQAHLNEISEIIKNALPLIKKLYALLFSMNFPSYFHSNVDISTVDKLDQENSSSLLGQIEEFIHFLLIAMSLKAQNSVKIPSEIKNIRSSSNKKIDLKDILEEKDIYDEPELEDIKVPISIHEMKIKAQTIFEKRRSLLKIKGTGNERNSAKTPKNYRFSNEDL